MVVKAAIVAVKSPAESEATVHHWLLAPLSDAVTGVPTNVDERYVLLRQQLAERRVDQPIVANVDRSARTCAALAATFALTIIATFITAALDTTSITTSFAAASVPVAFSIALAAIAAARVHTR